MFFNRGDRSMPSDDETKMYHGLQNLAQENQQLQADLRDAVELLTDITNEVKDYERRTGDVVKSWPPKAIGFLNRPSIKELINQTRKETL